MALACLEIIVYYANSYYYISPVEHDRKAVILWKIFSKIIFPEPEESPEIKTFNRKRDN